MSSLTDRRERVFFETFPFGRMHAREQNRLGGAVWRNKMENLFYILAIAATGGGRRAEYPFTILPIFIDLRCCGRTAYKKTLFAVKCVFLATVDASRISNTHGWSVKTRRHGTGQSVSGWRPPPTLFLSDLLVTAGLLLWMFFRGIDYIIVRRELVSFVG